MKLLVLGKNFDTTITANSKTSLASSLKKLSITEFSERRNPFGFVAVDYEKKSLREAKKLGLLEDKSCLIRMEPFVVCPSNAIDSDRSFGLIINVGRDPLVNKHASPWPQNWDLTYLNSISINEKLGCGENIVLINGNKYSSISGELYSLRRKCAHGINALDVYGTNWNRGLLFNLKFLLGEGFIGLKAGHFPSRKSVAFLFKRIPNWKGSPKNKLQTMSRYKLSLVIENSEEFLSEKLFDSFFSGCVPIYVGPDVSHFGIPPELVIQVSPELESIVTGIQRAKSLDYESWLIDLKTWLNDPKTEQKWSANYVFDRMAKSISTFMAG
jgi:hypothetical protein